MSALRKIFDKYIQKQVTAGNNEFAFRLADYAGYHHDSEGQPFDYDEMYEDNAPREVLEDFESFLIDHPDYHPDDDRSDAWEWFLSNRIDHRDKERNQEMGRMKSLYDAEKNYGIMDSMPTETKLRKEREEFASKDFKKVLAKYVGMEYKEPFNGRTQNNWEDMLGRWDKYIAPDFGVSKAPKKNPSIEDEFVNIPNAVASKTLKSMLKKYAQQEQFGDFDTQIHPEDDSMTDRFQNEFDNLKSVDSLFQEYGHHYSTAQLKRAFKEGLQVGLRGY